MGFDRRALKNEQAGALNTFSSGGSSVSDAVTTVGQAHTDQLTFSKAAADGMASTATAETYLGLYVPYDCTLTAAYFIPTSGGLTADNTNFATITISKRDSAAANKTTIATITTTITSSGNLTQGVAEPSVVAAGGVSIAAGSTITFEIAKSGSGVVVPAGLFTLLCEWN